MRVLQTAFDADAMSERLPVPKFDPATSLYRFQTENRLRVGVAPDCPGFSWLNERTGRFEGIDIAFARKVAQAIFGGTVISSSGKVEFVEVALKDRITAIETGHVDIVASALAITAERRKRIAFTEPYFGSSLGVITRTESSIETVGDLDGAILAVVETTVGDTLANARRLGCKVFEVPNKLEMIELVRDGTADAALSASSILQEYEKLYKDELVTRPWSLESFAFGIGLPKGDAVLLEFLNDRVRGLVDSGFIALADACRRR